MNKSLGSYIGIDESANIMFEKAMLIPDELIIKYFELVTDIHPDDIEKLELDMKENKINPRDIKAMLAKGIVTLYHGVDRAIIAEKRFKKVLQKKEIPEDINTIEVSENNFDLIQVLVDNKIVSSKNEVRRLLSQGGVKVNGKSVSDIKDLEVLVKL